MIEDQCSDESDKKNRNKKKLEDAEGRSQDPFVRKKMLVQEKIAETREVCKPNQPRGGVLTVTGGGARKDADEDEGGERTAIDQWERVGQQGILRSAPQTLPRFERGNDRGHAGGSRRA